MRALTQELATAEQNVATGAAWVAKQRALVAKLANDGHDTQRAEELLAVFEDVQTQLVAAMDRLIVERCARRRRRRRDTLQSLPDEVGQSSHASAVLVIRLAQGEDRPLE